MLEIGTGSGYQTAVLAQLSSVVFSIERHGHLSAQAAERLARLGITNVQLIVADGTLGWPAEAPYDRILITAATSECPPALMEQVVEGGLIIAPIGHSEHQILTVFKKTADGWQQQLDATCRFVPLIGGVDRSEPG